MPCYKLAVQHTVQHYTSTLAQVPDQCKPCWYYVVSRQPNDSYWYR